MTTIIIKDLDKNKALDREALRSVSGGNFMFGPNAGVSYNLQSQIYHMQNYLNASEAWFSNPANIYPIILGGVRQYRQATGRSWGGIYGGHNGFMNTVIRSGW
ncbi:MAG: hypothetical protein K1566_17690 [Candidatus Thiodiazotropha sp. (ex. Lucinisca nassula)]|nr:hypothetical protein [Candidatus Thiodiazotropha sp. (ex. Lucinisca nassula)]MBW9271475.1 hypothetical protein [Candidatus Thiodiazotropha sp. (ex. Lucinisca nassula)]